MNAYGGVNVYIHIFLTSALAGGEWSASRPGRFTSGDRILDRRLGGPQSQSGRLGEENIIEPYRDSNSEPSVVQPIASRYSGSTVSTSTSGYRHSLKHGFNPLTSSGNAEIHLVITQRTAVSSVATVLTVAVNQPVSQPEQINASLMYVTSVTAHI
jgi:hypothetical protein